SIPSLRRVLRTARCVVGNRSPCHPLSTASKKATRRHHAHPLYLAQSRHTEAGRGAVSASCRLGVVDALAQPGDIRLFKHLIRLRAVGPVNGAMFGFPM